MLDINDDKRSKELDLERNSGGDFVNLKRNINQKLNLLEIEAQLQPNAIFEEERVQRKMKE